MWIDTEIFLITSRARTECQSCGSSLRSGDFRNILMSMCLPLSFSLVLDLHFSYIE
jgi:hypothetical protein